MSVAGSEGARVAGEAASAGARVRGRSERPRRSRGASWLRGLAAASAVAAALLVPSVADARAPKLTSIVQDAQNLTHGTMNWSLPAGVKARFVEGATSPETYQTGYAKGYFRQDNFEVGLFNVFQGDETHNDFTLTAGTHYVHVAGQDTSYRSCPAREFSSTFKFTFTSDNRLIGVEDVGGGSDPCPSSGGGGGGGSGGGGGGGGGGSGGGGDNGSPRFQTFSARRVQDVDKLYVIVRVNEPGSVTAAATVNVRGGSARIYRFRTVKRNVAAGARTRLRLKLSKKSLRAVKRALTRGKPLRAKVTVTARNRAGKARVVRKSVVLRP